ncbi:MAG: hypothetical protein Q9195_000028 [Heterodermia aff. obscurata]
MPRPRPQLSITLPRNFTFHYTEGDEPKTPEQDLPIPSVPLSPHAYRIKRRSRPGLSNRIFDHTATIVSQDVPIPTIEAPESIEPVRPSFHQRSTEPPQGLLAPVATRPFMTAPRTPTIQRSLLSDTWNKSINESDGSLESDRSKGGSCTSPDSDVPDPFGSRPIRKRILRERPKLETCFAMKPKQAQTHWTAEMDRHLWTTYLFYLQDPTVTPFKLLPGVSPPLGVCHRVAREARRTWRGGKVLPRTNLDSGATVATSSGSPDTITASRSGSNTPTGSAPSKPPLWPKSGSATRRRLRELCKRKPTIAPHYQRLLQSRSPSPFSSSPRSQIRSSRAMSPLAYPSSSSPFNTRDVQLSLTTSTAATMQPNGPLAQLAKPEPQNQGSARDWFNDPIVPWASPSTAPSDLGHNSEDTMDTSQLGSPFGFHTWGPGRSRQNHRPTTPRTQSSDVSTIGPTLRSPVRLHETFPYPGVTKRRAQHQLEDEMSPGGTDMRKELLESLFGAPAEGRHRRVRSRGFSLGDVKNEARLADLFTPPSANENTGSSVQATDVTQSSTLNPHAAEDPAGRLGSPFAGIARRPSRGTPRHAASASLSAYDPNACSSIEQRLSHSDQDELTRLLRGQRDAMNASIGFSAL